MTYPTVIVVGAGVGGLACAARLAALGHRVTVFEQGDTVGGLLGRMEQHTPAGTFRFDTGPGLLTLPGVFADLFTATGTSLAHELDLVALDPIVRHVFSDGSVLDSCAEPAEFAARVAAVFGTRAERDWRRLWRRAERVWRASWSHVLRSPIDSPAAAARLAWRVRDLAAIAPGLTLHRLGRRYLTDQRLRALLDRYATYAGSDPRRAPAALVAIPYAELKFGGWYVRGGLRAIADALVRRCLAHGVAIHTGTTVAEILTERRRVLGVRLADGSRHRADAVVANTPAVAPLHRLERPTSMSAFVIMLAVRGKTSGLAHHTVFFPPDYGAEFDAIFGRPALPAPDPAILVTVADDPSARPDGHEGWFILVNAPRQGLDGVDWRASGVASDYADHVLTTLARRGFDVRDRVLARVVRTPADLADATKATGGAIYGTARHGVAGLLRPPNRGPVRGLFRVGGSTHPGGGLPMVALSAEIVAAAISAET